MADKKKIYIFINSNSPGWVVPMALCEDGYCLAQHCCSHERFVNHDMGITSDWKHDGYNEHCGEGNWELEYVKECEVEGHTGISSAYKLNQEIGKAVENEA
jgi:hypothetical protein